MRLPKVTTSAPSVVYNALGDGATHGRKDTREGLYARGYVVFGGYVLYLMTPRLSTEKQSSYLARSHRIVHMIVM